MKKIVLLLIIFLSTFFVFNINANAAKEIGECYYMVKEDNVTCAYGLRVYNSGVPGAKIISKKCSKSQYKIIYYYTTGNKLISKESHSIAHFKNAFKNVNGKFKNAKNTCPTVYLTHKTGSSQWYPKFFISVRRLSETNYSKKVNKVDNAMTSLTKKKFYSEMQKMNATSTASNSSRELGTCEYSVKHSKNNCEMRVNFVQKRRAMRGNAATRGVDANVESVSCTNSKKIKEDPKADSFKTGAGLKYKENAIAGKTGKKACPPVYLTRYIGNTYYYSHKDVNLATHIGKKWSLGFGATGSDIKTGIGDNGGMTKEQRKMNDIQKDKMKEVWKAFIKLETGKKVKTCDEIIGKDTKEILKIIFLGVRIFTPIILLILTMLDFTKAIANAEELNKSAKKFAKRGGVTVLIMLAPSLVNFFIAISEVKAGCTGIW